MSPVVGLPACLSDVKPGRPFHIVGDKYLRAISEFSGCQPLIFPALGPESDMDAILDRLDGLLLTGSPSNIEPHHYGEGDKNEPNPDPARDATTLPLIHKALDRDMPILAICRGFQEMNVALGGSLHQRIHEVPGRMVHHENENDPLDTQYGPAHPVTLTENGYLSNLLNTSEITVNSLHGQGVKDLAPSTRLEAIAPDGTAEAFTVSGAKGFTLAVQWHPEYKPQTNLISQVIFKNFGVACQSFADSAKRNDM
jgi:putative glutamine amidotransferase